MRATAFFVLILALLAFGSRALAATTHHRKSATDATTAIPWTKKPAPSVTATALPARNSEPDGLVVIEEKAYVPRQPTGPANVIAQPTTQVWTIKQGETLTEALNNWAKRAGYSVVWNADHTFDIEAAASFDGDFTKAITSLFSAYKDADRPVVVDLYPDQKPKPVVVVSNAKKAAQ